MLEVDSVKENFSKSFVQYNNNSVQQYNAAKSIVNYSVDNIFISNDDYIIDLGAGTGHVSKSLLEKSTIKTDLSIDFSINSLKINPYCDTSLVADLRNLPLSYINHDRVIIFSSYALQWLSFDDIQNLFDYIFDIVGQGSLICLSIPSDKSFYQFRMANEASGCNFRLLDLPNHDYLKRAIDLDKYKINYYNETNDEYSYSSAINFLKSLKLIGANKSFLDYNYISIKKIKKINDILFKEYDNIINWNSIELIIEKK